MKKIISLSLALMICASLSSIAGLDKTAENLMTAFKGESTASAKYAAFAEQARKEGLVQIAVMFTATSKAEAIHASNHKSVLEKMGQKVDTFSPEYNVKTTRENIENAIQGETYEMLTMYPGFIATAKSESAGDAIKSFRWAMETEKKHQAMYQFVSNALNSNTVSKISTIYWVCPKCGNTFDVVKPEASCSFCSTSSSRYFKFIK